MTKGKRGFVTTFHEIVATFRGRFLSLPRVPNNVIAFLLEQYLKEKVPTLDASVSPHMRDDQRRLLCPPSLCESQTAHFMNASRKCTVFLTAACDSCSQRQSGPEKIRGQSHRACLAG